jgi:hypothetical protein
MIWLWLFVLCSRSLASPSTKCPSASFFEYNITADSRDNIAIFNSNQYYTGNASKLDPTLCSNIHPKSRIVMVRTREMAYFINKTLGPMPLSIWSGLYKEVASNVSNEGWVWYDGVNSSVRPVIWMTNWGEPNGQGNERNALWTYASPGGHVDSNGYTLLMLCGVKGEF